MTYSGIVWWFSFKTAKSERPLLCFLFSVVGNKPKAPLCKGSCQMPQVHLTEGLFHSKTNFFTIPPSRFASHLPLHKGGFRFVPALPFCQFSQNILPYFFEKYWFLGFSKSDFCGIIYIWYILNKFLDEYGEYKND